MCYIHNSLILNSLYPYYFSSQCCTFNTHSGVHSFRSVNSLRRQFLHFADEQANKAPFMFPTAFVYYTANAYSLRYRSFDKTPTQRTNMYVSVYYICTYVFIYIHSILNWQGSRGCTMHNKKLFADNIVEKNN